MINLLPNSSMKNINFLHVMQEVSLVTVLNICYKIFKTYQIDDLIEEYGHKDLWLPPHHCNFNPIELVWPHTKKGITTATLVKMSLE
jgi:transposase